MKRTLALLVSAGLAACAANRADAVIIIGGSVNNGNLDRTYAQEIVPGVPPDPGFFLPKPIIWENIGSRAITGPYEDEMSSEPWAGPAPTPETTDGTLNGPHPQGHGGPDGGVFFKAFSGNATNGPATGHLQQDNPATPGLTYIATGWAGAEANLLVADAQFGIEFLDAGGNVIPGAGQIISLLPTLFVDNGQPFDYKQYNASAVAPANAAEVRLRVSMIAGQPNPLGGGQAFVVDDFTLDAVPEPTSALTLGAIGALGLIRRGRR
jgi:hypothetical protein